MEVHQGRNAQKRDSLSESFFKKDGMYTMFIN